ncbi:MAG: crossover junction endodeoxyribonuclease RuvC [Phycisphaerae bacterium]
MTAMARQPEENRTSAAHKSARPTVILGIDPGLERTGYALLADAPPAGPRLCEAGLIRLPAKAPLPRRLVHLLESLEELIQAHRPTILTCEALFAHYKHPRTAILMGHARGVILAAAARAGLDVLTVTPASVKKLLTGSGRATKKQMQWAVTATLGLAVTPEPHDVADAIAIALCGLRSRRAAAITARTLGEGR